MDLHLGDQRLVERVVGACIRHPHLQDVVDIAREPVRLLHLGPRAERVQEARLPFRLVFRGADQNEEAGVESQRLGIEKHGLRTHDPRLAHLADAVPDRRLRRPRRPGDLVERLARVTLQFAKDLPIQLVDPDGHSQPPAIMERTTPFAVRLEHAFLIYAAPLQRTGRMFYLCG